MAAVPTTRTFVAGEVVLASYFNTNIRDVLLYLLSPPILELRQTTLQALTNNTITPLDFQTEDVDSSGMHSTVTDISRATAVYPGWYTAGGGVGYVGNVTGVRNAIWYKNAAVVNGAEVQINNAGGVTIAVPARMKNIFLNVTDYIQLSGFQNSGGSLNTDAGAGKQSNMSLVYAST